MSYEASVASQLDRLVFTFAEQTVDGVVLTEAVEVNEAHGDQVDVVSFRDEVQAAERTISVPVFGLPDPDDVTIHTETYGLLTEQHPFPVSAAFSVTALCQGVRRQGGEHHCSHQHR
jgi:hypothetical protein